MDGVSDLREIVLTGCSPAPLAKYLKGLGILRISSALDPRIKAAWIGTDLRLTTNRSSDELRAYVLKEYAPTPVLAPWNGGSGFYKKDKRTSILAIKSSKSPRFASYRASLDKAERAFELEGLNRQGSPKNEAKTRLLSRLRGLLPDLALEWFDASIVLSGDTVKYPPLLGTGGNDGRLDFTNNFMQRLLELIDAASGEATAQSDGWLRLALFGELASNLVPQAIGQFSPGQVGGPNSTTGYDSKGNINPWDFVLMIEGALTFAAATVRRNAQSHEGVLSYPFTVRTTSAGSGALGAEDSASSRGELWMPLWSNPATYGEVRTLLSEGRVALGTRPAKDSLDFVRAVHRLGGYRGVDRFQRFGLLMRSGKAYLATPLECIQVTNNPGSGLIDEIERNGWFEKFRRFSRDDKTANRFAELCHRLENRIFALAQRRPKPADVQSLLMLLGDIQHSLSKSAGAQQHVPPVPQLSAHWMQSADDGSPSFRIARALAGLRGVGDQPLPVRSQLFPIHHVNQNEWLDKARKLKAIEKDPVLRIRLQIHSQRDLESDLIELLRMRLDLPARLDFADKPLNSSSGIDLADLATFLSDDRLDSHISSLLSALALCEHPKTENSSAGDGEIHAAFALCKLAVAPDHILHRLGRLPASEQLSAPPQLLSKLANDDPNQARQAVKIAWRRLRGSSLEPTMPFNQLPELVGIKPRRLAAALLIPLNFGTYSALVNAVLQTESDLIAEGA